MAHFNPPPTWPEPPAGWQPPRGWSPDPTWPAPPPGWQLWLDDAAARRQRRAARLRAGTRPSRRLALGVVGSLSALAAAVVVTAGPGAGQQDAVVPAAATAAPGTTHVLTPSPTPTVPPLGPSLQIGCPATTSARGRLDAAFTHQVSAQAPYTVSIDYGDGRTYQGDDAHLASVFSHSYSRAGSFTVKAVIADASGASASSTCALTWSVLPVRSAASAASTSSAPTAGATAAPRATARPPAAPASSAAPVPSATSSATVVAAAPGPTAGASPAASVSPTG